ncbi:MAG TPA: zinc dependent phospholipase C family protein [Clostridiales bacterium]|nr:zinc dependent phospholipase C family protein [Clostridiales bacterium]
MAHYQFGQEMIKRLDPELMAVIHNHRREYEIGLQGPDIFYYYKTYRPNRVFRHGLNCHSRPAIQMFAPMFKENREGAALAYLLGLICHYALDRSCHPYVYGNSRGLGDHFKIESAFDCYIIKNRSLKAERFECFPISDLDYAALASLWPGIPEKAIKKSIRAQRFCTRLIDRRNIVRAFETGSHKNPQDLADKKQEAHTAALEMLYQKALLDCPLLVKSAVSAMRANTEYCVGFHLNHEGVDPSARRELIPADCSIADSPAG